MTGSAAFDLFISILGLIIIVGLIMLAIRKIAPDEFFVKVARLAVGGAAILIFAYALKGFFFGGGGGGPVITPIGVIEFAIALLCVMLVLWFVYLCIDYFCVGDEYGYLNGPLKYVIGCLALIAILGAAATVMLGGSIFIGGGNNAPFRAERHGALLGNAAWASAGPLQELRGHASVPGAADPA